MKKILFFLLIAGCSPNWVRPQGVSDQQFAQDRYRCMRETGWSETRAMESIAAIGKGYTVTGPDRGMFEACMESLGYTK